ncbi:hypothetical protein [Amycolatopsis minnesotensis]|uniref:Beta-lactamase n=1 Tax=Amycolatopsis minnesotensis TaxID=337894 RepID=A0ABN2QWL4_9PSEU
MVHRFRESRSSAGIRTVALEGMRPARRRLGLEREQGRLFSVDGEDNLRQTATAKTSFAASLIQAGLMSPPRPRSHELDAEFERALGCLLPPGWLSQRQGIDYGTDYGTDYGIDAEVGIDGGQANRHSGVRTTRMVTSAHADHAHNRRRSTGRAHSFGYTPLLRGRTS